MQRSLNVSQAIKKAQDFLCKDDAESAKNILATCVDEFISNLPSEKKRDFSWFKDAEELWEVLKSFHFRFEKVDKNLQKILIDLSIKIANASLASGEEKKAIDAIKRCRAIFPCDKQLLIAAGEIALTANDLVNAARFFQQIVLNNQSNNNERAAGWLGWAKIMVNNKDQFLKSLCYAASFCTDAALKEKIKQSFLESTQADVITAVYNMLSHRQSSSNPMTDVFKAIFNPDNFLYDFFETKHFKPNDTEHLLTELFGWLEKLDQNFTADYKRKVVEMEKAERALAEKRRQEKLQPIPATFFHKMQAQDPLYTASTLTATYNVL